jgi:hypothetical protein
MWNGVVAVAERVVSVQRGGAEEMLWEGEEYRIRRRWCMDPGVQV